jgi:hypothetical protein
MRLFLGYVETRAGIVLPDPVLSLLSPHDFRWITFSLIYSGILLGIISLSFYPFALLLTVRAYILMILLRIVCMFLLPLDPPRDMIPLVDPFVQWPGVYQTFTRDLFFSGHTATIVLLAFTAQWKDMKIIFACTAFLVAMLLLLQHVHYTIDVVAAPCFAFVAYGIANWITIGEVPVGSASPR